MKRARGSGAQKEIQKLEKSIRTAKDKLAKLRRRAGAQPVADYVFKGPLGERLSLAEAFGDRDELIVVHNMGRSCSYCTMWADGFNGLLPHLEDRAAFLVESADDAPAQRRFASDRGWRFRMVSSKGTSFKADMGYADEDGDPVPGVSTFVKRGGQVLRVADTHFGPGDNFCVTWDLLDLLPPKEWGPRFHYLKG